MPQLIKTKEEQSSINNNTNDLNNVLRALLDLAVPNAAANTMQQAKSIESGMTPYQKGASKALEKLGEQHVVEAVASGMSPMDVQNSEIFKTPPLQMPEKNNTTSQPQQQIDANSVLTSLLAMSQQNTPQQKEEIPNATKSPTSNGQEFMSTPNNSILAKLFQVAGFGVSGEEQLNLANAALARQKLAGKEPLQEGDREKLGYEYQKALAVEEIKKAADLEKEGRLKPQDIFNKFESASTPFITIRDAQSRIEESAKSDSPASDLALIFNYMKVLDPQSTVREGEFANAENTRGVTDAVRNLYNKVMKGGRLQNNQRADFLNTSRRIFKGAESQQKKTTEQFKSLAKRNGISFENVVRDTGLAQESSKSMKIGRFNVEVK